jgi:hypothetical protein
LRLVVVDTFVVLPYEIKAWCARVQPRFGSLMAMRLRIVRLIRDTDKKAIEIIGTAPRLGRIGMTADLHDYSLPAIFVASVVFIVAATEVGRFLGLRESHISVRKNLLLGARTKSMMDRPSTSTRSSIC